MRRERLHRDDDESVLEHGPQASEPAVAVPRPGAAELQDLSHSAGNQAVVRMLQAQRQLQRVINRGDRFSAKATTLVQKPPDDSKDKLLSGATDSTNSDFSDNTRLWIQNFCKSNGNGNRF